MAVLAPTPTAIVAMATPASAGLFRSARKAAERSREKPLMPPLLESDARCRHNIYIVASLLAPARSLASQRLDGIQPGGAARRQPAGQQGSGGKQEESRGERERIVRPHVDQNRPQEAC